MTLKPFRKSLLILFSFTILFFAVIQNSFSQSELVIHSIDEAIALALKNNSSVINAKLDKLKAQEKVSEVYSENLIPTLTLTSIFQRAIKKQVFYIEGESFEIGGDNYFNNLIDLRESIPVLGTPVFSGIRIAEYYLKIQKEGISAAENDVRTNVRNAYYTVLLAKATVEVNKLTLENAEQNFNVVNAKYKNGVATEFDYLRAKVRVDNSIPVLSKSERNLEISRNVLLNAIGLKTIEDIDVSDNLTYDSTEVWGDTDYMISKISENYVAVRQLNVTKEINEELVDVDKANYLPKLFLFGQYTLTTSENDGQELYNYRFYNTMNLGLGLSWDLNLFRNSYKVNQSEIEVKKTQEQISELQQRLKLTAQSAIIALNDAKERIVAQRKTLSLAERSLELANASYRAGTLNQIDVLAAELSISETRLTFLQAVYDYQIAKAAIEKLLEE